MLSKEVYPSIYDLIRSNWKYLQEIMKFL